MADCVTVTVDTAEADLRVTDTAVNNRTTDFTTDSTIISATATVENLGDASGTGRVQIDVNGELVHEEDVTLRAGASTAVSSGDLELQDGDGDYDVCAEMRTI